MISFSRDQIDLITNQLTLDLSILRELFVMDYSLLMIIVHFPDLKNQNYEKIINLLGDRRCCRRLKKNTW